LGATVAAGAIAGVAGDIAGQVTGLAIGTQTEYNWKQTVGAGLGGALFGPVASGLTKAFGGAAAVNNSLVRSYTVAAASGFGSGFGGDLATQTLEAAFGDREWRNISVGRSLLVGTLGAVAAPAAKGLQDNLPKQLTNFGSTEWFQAHPRANPFNYRPTVRGVASIPGNIGVKYVGPEAPNSSAEAPTQLTRAQGQAIIDKAQNAMRPNERDQVVLTLTQLENGRFVLTVGSRQNQVTRVKGGRTYTNTEELTVPSDAIQSARQSLRESLGDEAVLLVTSEGGRRSPTYIPIQSRVVPGAPGQSGWHGEGRGIQAGLYYGSPARRQWSSLGAPGSTGHRGAACPDCEQLQQQYGVTNETGFQSQGGRFDQQ
jgi:hypothetical protein